jgi:hypothetical protein
MMIVVFWQVGLTGSPGSSTHHITHIYAYTHILGIFNANDRDVMIGRM